MSDDAAFAGFCQMPPYLDLKKLVKFQDRQGVPSSDASSQASVRELHADQCADRVSSASLRNFRKLLPPVLLQRACPAKECFVNRDLGGACVVEGSASFRFRSPLH